MHRTNGIVDILLFTRSLGAGGAERQLIALAQRLDRARFRIHVVTFFRGGVLETELMRSPDVVLYDLGKRSRYDILRPLIRFLIYCRKNKIRLINTYIGGQEFAFVAKAFLRCRVLLGIRNSNIFFEESPRLTRVLFVLSAKLSHFADGLIANSSAGREYYHSHGYRNRRFLVIHNGFDSSYFCPDPESGSVLRVDQQIEFDEFVVAMVGRLHTDKDYSTYFRACSQVIASGRRIRILCVGHGTDKFKADLVAEVDALGLTPYVIWLDHCANMASLYNAIDVLVLSAPFEGLPNVVGEAMSCGIPCITTDVGDCRALVGDAGFVVPVGDADQIATMLMRLMDSPPATIAEIRRASRDRIVEHFSLEALARRTEAVYAEVLGLPPVYDLND